MSKKKVFNIVLVCILILMMLTFFLYKKNVKHPFVKSNSEVQFVVDKGDSLFNVINKLNEDGLMKNKYLMKLYIKNNNLDKEIRNGKYKISSDISLQEFVYILNKGMKDEDTVTVTIPEGYDLERIAKLFEDKGLTSKSEFIKSCEEYKLPSFIKTNDKQKYALEGYLFPDTYDFKKGTSNNEIISTMINRFEKVISEIKSNNEDKIDDVDVNKVITIASIVEKEARVDEDRPYIASVINNRLEKNMRLQIDATVLYALGQHKDRLVLQDLKIDSPYNTYKVNGLTPGAICSPGKESIEAALNPSNTDYLYYVLQDSKKHYFTNNYQDFLKAKEKYKKQLN